jgi:hypothetical protein
MSSSCCGLVRKKEKSRVSTSTIWKFTHGSNVKAETFESAVIELETIHPTEFWASEITEGTWDVQLSQSVIVYSVSAPTVMEAVRRARWKVHLDKSFKSIAI